MTHNIEYYYFLCTFSVQNRTAVELTVKPLCAILANLSVHFLCYLFVYLFGYLSMYFYISFSFYVIGKYILTYLFVTSLASDTSYPVDKRLGSALKQC